MLVPVPITISGFKLESYSSKELLYIFNKMVEEQGWKLDKDCISEKWFEKNIILNLN